MNSVCEDIKNILVAGLGFVLGTDLFIGRVPKGLTNIITLLDTSSTPPQNTLDSKVYYKESFQIIVSGLSYTEAHTKARQVIDYFPKTNIETGGSLYLYIRLANGPTSLTGSKDTNEETPDLTQLSINFNAERKQLT